jgi:2'-5' RNA ligase
VAPVQDIRRAVRAAIGNTFGAGAVPERATGYQPHVSMAYVNSEQPAQAALDAVQRTAADSIEVRIDAVSLIELHRDNRMYEWRTIETVPLGAGRTNDHSTSIRSMVEFGETSRRQSMTTD